MGASITGKAGIPAVVGGAMAMNSMHHAGLPGMALVKQITLQYNPVAGLSAVKIIALIKCWPCSHGMQKIKVITLYKVMARPQLEYFHQS